jgi:triacylglycerol lipase
VAGGYLIGRPVDPQAAAVAVAAGRRYHGSMVPRLRAPIVLVHGLFGFSRVQLAGYTMLDYFPGVAEALEKAGNRVYMPFLTPTGGVADRARQLKEFIQSVSPHEPVHLFAHSMGGLDARYMVSRLGMNERVLTLTTLGTPHRGTTFADWGTQRLERVARPFFDFLGVPCQAFYDLTRTRCCAFNDETPDAPGVRYFSVAARHDGNLFRPEWLVPYHIVLATEGPNDGVVSVESARYGEDVQLWDGDHLSLVNWLNPFVPNAGRTDQAPRYAELVRRLADLGY